MNKLIRTCLQSAVLVLSCSSSMVHADHSSSNFFSIASTFSSLGIGVNPALGSRVTYDAVLDIGPTTQGYALSANAGGNFTFQEIPANGRVTLPSRLCSSVTHAFICNKLNLENSNYTPSAVRLVGGPKTVVGTISPSSQGPANSQRFRVDTHPAILLGTSTGLALVYQASDRTYAPPQTFTQTFTDLVRVVSDFHLFGNEQGGAHVFALDNPTAPRILVGEVNESSAALSQPWTTLNLNLSAFTSVTDLTVTPIGDQLFVAADNDLWTVELNSDGQPAGALSQVQTTGLSLTGLVRFIEVTPAGRSFIVSNADGFSAECLSTSDNTSFRCAPLANTGPALAAAGKPNIFRMSNRFYGFVPDGNILKLCQQAGANQTNYSCTDLTDFGVPVNAISGPIALTTERNNSSLQANSNIAASTTAHYAVALEAPASDLLAVAPAAASTLLVCSTSLNDFTTSCAPALTNGQTQTEAVKALVAA